MSIKKQLTVSEMLPSRPRNGRSRPDDLFAVSAARTAAQYECTWFDESRLHELPNLVVPLTGSLDNLFADVATYYPERMPLTAYTHVVNRELAEEVVEAGSGDRRVKERPTARRQAAIWLGAIFGEALTRAYRTGGDEGDVSFSVCRRGLSFSLARYSHLYGMQDPSLIWTNWAELRNLTGQEADEPELHSTTFIARTLSSMERPGRDDEGLGNVANYLFQSHSEKDLALAFDHLYPNISTERRGLAEHFDARVPAFERIATRILENRRGTELDTIALAFFANLIAPGTIAHTKLLSRRLDTCPSILLWYSVFAALSPEFDGQLAFQGLGAKLARDIEADFSLGARPAADISLDEMKALSRIGLRARVVKPAHPRSVLVSIFPGVDVHARFTDAHDMSHQDIEIGERRLQQISRRDIRVRALLQEAQKLLDDAFEHPALATWPYSKKPKKPRGAGQR